MSDRLLHEGTLKEEGSPSWFGIHPIAWGVPGLGLVGELAAYSNDYIPPPVHGGVVLGTAVLVLLIILTAPFRGQEAAAV